MRRVFSFGVLALALFLVALVNIAQARENPFAAVIAHRSCACEQGRGYEMADQKRVLIVGETPENIDFSDPAIPKGLTPGKIRDGLEQSLNDLRGKGRLARLVFVNTEQTAPAELDQVLSGEDFDVIVVGAGLRIVPKQTRMFEVVMNLIHAQAPRAKIAFNISPEDSANAAERLLSRAD